MLLSCRETTSYANSSAIPYLSQSLLSHTLPLLLLLCLRETHHISGAAVKMAEDRGTPLSSLSVADLQSIHPLFADDVVKVRITEWH